MLTDTLHADLTEAMRARDKGRVGALRLAIAAVQEAAVAGKAAKALDDVEVRRVLAKEARKHEEAAEAFASAGRADRAAEELAARDVLTAYLPAALSDIELDGIVTEVLTAGGYTTPTQMGPAMRDVNARVAGRADGKVVADLVKRRLAGG